VQRLLATYLIATFGGIPFVRDTKRVWTGNDDFQFKSAWFAPGNARTEVVQRLLAAECELCGAKGVPLQIHHIRKLADLNQPGRAPKPPWMQIMSARKRKTLAVCEACHRDIHAGRYDGPSPAKLTGEPDALKGASPVRRGAAGNVPARGNALTAYPTIKIGRLGVPEIGSPKC
jgi:hypothetical protein